MANLGKFIDRSPLICAAGKSTGVPEQTVNTSMREFPVDDAIKLKENWIEDIPPKKPPPVQNDDFSETDTQIKPLMNPSQEFLDDPEEPLHESNWKKSPNSVKDEIQGVPAGAAPLDIAFEKPTLEGDTEKELVTPPKVPYRVMCDDEVCHANYRKTHDYNLPEHNKPAYMVNKHFEAHSAMDSRGIWVRCACDWHNIEASAYSGKIQAEFLDRTKSVLGHGLTPNHILDMMPKGHTFGMKSHPELSDAEDVSKGLISPCIFKRDFLEWVSSLNKFRGLLKQDSEDFDDFYNKCIYCDKDGSGYLPIDQFYEQCICHRLTVPKEHMESLLKLLNVIMDNKIDYKAFIEILHCDDPPLTLMPFADVPPQNQFYVTTNQADVCDYLIINNARKSTGVPKETVNTTLREYPVDDVIDALKHNANIWTEDRFVAPRQLPPIQNPAFSGTHTQIRPILNPPIKTRYQEAIDNLRETHYESYWKKPLGSIKDQIPGLPAGTVPLDITFGKPTLREVTVKELVNPPKTPYQVMWDSQVGHAYYRKTHNDYNPSEPVNRGYKTPPYMANKRFGAPSAMDSRGIWVRCACDWHKKEPVVYASKIQADFLDRTRPVLGQPLTPYDKLGYLPIAKFYDQCVCDHLTYPKEHIESLLKLLNIIVGDKINYKAFIDILNCNKPPLELMPFNDVPPQNQYYVTTNQAAVCDYLVINNALFPTAGIPSRRHDLPRPIKPLEGCRADLDHLGEDTTANTVLNPSIYTNYGCSKKVGYNFPGETFEKLWQEGLKRDKTGCVCVDTFKTLVKTCCPQKKIIVDEQECDRIK
ncbi:hypothetical protein NQ317_004157 [Molorchus minor]|uniref:EFHB C-terminal EF-hand domain-containing protein n=1 Tax=Molorchus minor TaxID=1323400 RepID=A0ABQ9JVB4_9CUCU|nr:hypothetical protein NQ317_004157 [Molorchus minor]